MGSSQDRNPVEELAEEFLDRKRRGESPLVTEYTEKYPQWAEEIEDLFPALELMEELKPQSDDLSDGVDEESSATSIPQIRQIGDYRILRQIGRGGMGVVYEAEQQSLGRRVALKVLPRSAAGDEKAFTRFQREARAAARMHHTNIVPVFEVGQDQEHVFYAMQLIQGQGLDDVIGDLKQLRNDSRAGSVQPIKDSPHQLAASLVTGRFQHENLLENDSDKPSEEGSSPYAETVLSASGSTVSAVLPGQSELSSAETNPTAYYQSVAEIGLQTARALSYAHARGIIHRDIKPSNLLLDTTGVVWVTDFGLAKTGDVGLTHTGDILGTIRYMSPERFKGHCDVRADVYSLGLTLYELLALKPAFESPDRLKLIDMVAKTEVVPPRALDPRVPRDLETIVLKACDKDPKRRYQSADDMVEDLQRFVDDEPIKARRMSTWERLARWSRRNKGLATIAVLLLIINIAGPLMYWQSERSRRDAESAKEELEKNQVIINKTLADLDKEKRVSDQRAEDNADLANKWQNETKRVQEANEQKLQVMDELQTRVLSQKRDIYAGDILQVAIEAQRGNLTRMRELLLAYIPDEKRETDLRGPEWYYWWNFLNQSKESGRVETDPGKTVPTTYILPGGQRVGIERDGVIQIFERHDESFNLSDQPSYTVSTSLPTNSLNREVMLTVSGLVVENPNATDPEFPRNHPPSGQTIQANDYQFSKETFHLFGSDGKSQEFKFPPGALKHLSALAVSPNDRLVAALGVTTARSEAPICRTLIWSVDTGELLANLPYEGELNKIKFNQDGTLLAAYQTHGSQRKSDEERKVVVVYEMIQTGDQTQARELAIAWHNDDIDALFFNPKRPELLLGTLGWSNHLVKEFYLWTIANQQPLRRLGEETLPDFPHGEISPDGNLLAVSGQDLATIRLIDTSTGKLVNTLYNSEGFKISSLTFSPKGDRLIASGNTQRSGAVLEWTLNSPNLFALQTEPITLPPSTNPSDNYFPKPIYAISPNQSLLAYYDKDGLMLRNREREPRKLDTLPRFYAASSLIFSPDNQWLAASTPFFNQASRELVLQVRIYDTESAEEICSRDLPIELFSRAEMAFTSDPQLIVRVSAKVYVIDVDELNPAEKNEFLLTPSLAQTKEQTRQQYLLEQRNRLRFLSPLTTNRQTEQTMIAVLEPQMETASDNEIERSAENPDGLGGRWRLRVLDAASGETICSIGLPIEDEIHEVEADLQAIVLAPDGLHAGIIWSGRTEIWDLRSEGSVWDVSGNDLAFSSDGSLLAAMSREENPRRTIVGLDRSINTTRINTITLWNVEQKTELSTISLLGSGTDDIRFSPDSQRLITLHGYKPEGSADVSPQVRLWDVRSGHELLSIPVAKVNHYFWDIAFDPENQHLTSLTTFVFGKWSTGRDSSVAKVYYLSRMNEDEEALLVAKPLVDQLFDTHLLKQEVRLRLNADDKYLDHVRTKALELVDEHPDDDLSAITELCLKHSIESNTQLDPHRYLRWAETIQRWYPNDPRSQLVRGIAEYYNGNTDQALTLLNSNEVTPGLSEAVLSPDQNLVRHAFRTLAWLRADRLKQAEKEALEFCRAMRRDLGVNYFAVTNIEASNEIKSLFAQVNSQLRLHDCTILGSEVLPKQQAERILFVLDLNSDGVLTEADAPQDWDSLKGLDRNSDRNVSVEELSRLLSLAADGLNDQDEQVARYSRTLELTPLSSTNWGWRAEVWRRAREYQRALNDCDEAIRFDPTSIYARNVKGRVYLDRGNYSDAIREFEILIKLDPKSGAAWNNLGVCYERQGEEDKAIDYYNKSIELASAPYPLTLIHRANLYLQQGDMDKALEDLNSLIRIEPDSATNYERRGFVQLARPNYGAAIKDFEKVLELDPAQATPVANIVLALTLSGDTEQAAARFFSALEHEPDPGKRIQLVERLSGLDIDLTNFVELRPEDPVLLTALSRQQSARGDIKATQTLADAQRLAEEQLAAAPDDENAARSLATVMLVSRELTNQWTVLQPEPDDVKSAGGAALTKLDDGSILAGGTNPYQEVYTITARPQKQITCLMLEIMPHRSLPLGRSGRDLRLGNFLISRFELAVQDIAIGQPREIPIGAIASDVPVQPNGASSHIENTLGRGPGPHWTAWPHVQTQQRVVFELEEPLTIPDNGELRITISCSDPQYANHALGRFRLSVSDSPTAFREEQTRLAASKIEDAWEQLAAVYFLRDKKADLEELLIQRPETVLGFARYLADTGQRTEALDVLGKDGLPTDDLTFLQARGELYLQLNALDKAAEDHLQMAHQKPYSTLHWLKAASLLVADRDRDEARFQKLYPQLCNEVLKQFSEPTDRLAADVVKICAFFPQDESIQEQAIKMANDKIGSHPTYDWAVMTALLSDYRHKQYETALKRADRCLEISDQTKVGGYVLAYRNMRAFAYLIQAMSYHQLANDPRSNQSDKLEYVLKAEEALERGCQACDDGLPQYTAIGWWDTFLSQALLREAEETVHGKLEP